VVAYCCFGAEARVIGQADEPGTLDVGGGVRPDLVGQGLATRWIPTLIEFGMEAFAPERFRTAVAAFNERSLRVCQSAGFTITRTFTGPGREFCELVMPAPSR
jgi:RimJ/RimL family protein N-acetyltransferase